MNNNEDMVKVYKLVKKFVIDNKISCREDVYQSDYVIENAYGFIGDLSELIGFVELD